MNRSIKKPLLMLIITCAVFSLFMSTVNAQSNPSELFNTGPQFVPMTAELLKELQNAKPLPLPEIVMPEGALSIPLSEALPFDALPGFSLGWDPDSGLPQPDPTVGYTIRPGEGSPLDRMSGGLADFQTYGSAPTNPLSGPYAPFQRWNWYGNYIAQATQRIGKLFFDTTGDGIRNASCTASVIGNRTIATASHCLHSGGSSGRWYGNWLFCPSYYRAAGAGGPHPSRGCWSWSYGKISLAWLNNTAADRDYACIVTALTGDTIANRVGNVTGWTGRAWNWASSQPMISWGYPAGSPFPGYHIIVASSPEWYEVDMTSGDGQVSKYMGNDMTGGSSGGPWWMSVRHATYEYNDTDGSGATDPPGCSGCVPGGPYINGVNSHKRCLGSCYTPPTAGGGTFWQEMGSPQFRNTSGDTDESEDIFAACFNNE